jgi:predicted enzyme related to lactoylglutathione lyase
MKTFKSICLITQDLPGLRDFYQNVLEVTPEGDDSFVVFSTPKADLSICSAQSLEEMAPGLMNDSSAGNCFLEFEVEDVDKEYKRLKVLDAEVIKSPTTQPWGLRSVWFRDTDGNKINFFAPVTRNEVDDR